MGELVEYRTDAGPTRAYLATPTGGAGPGVVVIHESWGLGDHIRDVCDRFAVEGYVALAPDLCEGQPAAEPDAARRMMQELRVADAAMSLTGGIGYLLQHAAVTGDRIGIIGYGMGGALALVTADKAAGKVAAVDCYYGVFWYGEPEFLGSDCPIVLRVGSEDEGIPPDRIGALAERLRRSGASVEIKTYEDAGHAFFNDRRPDAYHAGAARAAWQDTLAFLDRYLKGGPGG